MNREIVSKDHPLMAMEIEEFDFSNPPIDPKELNEHLVSVMDEKNGLGLAANQLGLPYRAFVMRTTPRLVCFNPKIVFESDEKMVLEEGCLTYPGLYVKIRRSMWIRVRFQNADGEIQTEKLTGIAARCFQHELDHLNGINYLTRASRINLERAKREKKLLERKLKKYKTIPVLQSEDEINGTTD
jgi:peptide deformylase